MGDEKKKELVHLFESRAIDISKNNGKNDLEGREKRDLARAIDISARKTKKNELEERRRGIWLKPLPPRMGSASKDEISRYRSTRSAATDWIWRTGRTLFAT